MKVKHLDKFILFSSIVAINTFNASAIAADYSAVENKLKLAMSNEARDKKHISRDLNRKPVETLAFFGLRDNMTVLEIMPGGQAWYTRLLAPVMKDNGKLHVAYGIDWMGDLLTKPGYEKVSVQAEKSKVSRAKGTRFMQLENEKINLKNIDMVLTFRNYHNFTESSRRAINKAAYDVLKVGGIYGVVDHTRRHMQKINDKNGRRFDPVLAIKEIQQAGFELVDFSDLHIHEDDELSYEVGHKSVSGKTDRWTLKFRKVTGS